MSDYNYRVIINGEVPTLVRTQSEFGLGKYFESYTLGELAESANGTDEMVVGCSSSCLKHIFDGCEILPPANTAILTDMATLLRTF